MTSLGLQFSRSCKMALPFKTLVHAQYTHKVTIILISATLCHRFYHTLSVLVIICDMKLETTISNTLYFICDKYIALLKAYLACFTMHLKSLKSLIRRIMRSHSQHLAYSYIGTDMHTVVKYTIQKISQQKQQH